MTRIYPFELIEGVKYKINLKYHHDHSLSKKPCIFTGTFLCIENDDSYWKVIFLDNSNNKHICSGLNEFYILHEHEQ